MRRISIRWHVAYLQVLSSLFRLGSALASPPRKSELFDIADDDPDKEPGSLAFWMKVLLSCGLVVAGGVFSGLTLGLMGLDELHLRVLATSSDDSIERRNASKVLNLLKKGRHWVLVVLLLGNVIVNESLPIFLDSVIDGDIAAVVISTTLIVIFGIIPQAVCNRHGLSIGARCAPFVLGLMHIFAPIAWPTAKILDYLFGANEQHTYKKSELKSFLQFHRHGKEPLQIDEISILNGVLELSIKSVTEIMTPIRDVKTLSSDAILDHKMVDKLLLSGYSRFPVHEHGRPSAFIGLLHVKKLLIYDPTEAKPVSDFQLGILPEVGPEINCFQALNYFRTGRAHLLLVSENPGEPGITLGVVTLEDIIEEIIAEEIVDEFDRYEDNQFKRKAKRKGTASILQGIVEHVKRKQSRSTVGVDENSASLRRAIGGDETVRRMDGDVLDDSDVNSELSSLGT